MASKASENVKSVHADNEATSLSCLLAMPEYNKYDPDFINAVSTLLMLKGEHGSISDHETRHSGQRNADCSISDHETNYSGQRNADGAVGYRSLLVSDHETNCYRQRNVDGPVGYILRSRNYCGQRNTVGPVLSIEKEKTVKVEVDVKAKHRCFIGAHHYKRSNRWEAYIWYVIMFHYLYFQFFSSFLILCFIIWEFHLDWP